MELIGITPSNNKINLPFREVSYFSLPEKHSMPVKPDIKQLCLIKLKHIHESALS